MVVQVQAILFASLDASLFSVFLAMLGKQWLNRYASADKRGSTIERSRNRQRKLDGIVSWYFDHVMESLSLMLQVTLWLLGCAPRYLWEINRTVAPPARIQTSKDARTQQAIPHPLPPSIHHSPSTPKTCRADLHSNGPVGKHQVSLSALANSDSLNRFTPAVPMAGETNLA